MGTAAQCGSERSHAGVLSGRARGGLICAIFGSAFLFDALFFGRVATAPRLIVTTLLAASLVTWAVVQIRSYRGAPRLDADRQFWRAIATPFWINFALEWALCSGGIFWVSRIRRFDLIPQVLGVIVGLHFLPLAKWFRSPVYYFTGTAMVLGSLAPLLIPAVNLRVFAGYAVNGLVLWTTAAVNLNRNELARLKREPA